MIRTRRFPRIGWMALLLVAALSLAACGSASAPVADTAPKPNPAPAETAKPEAPAGPWEFTDDRGKKITLEKRPVRVVAQSNSAAALWDLGYEVVGVFGPQKRPDGSNDPEIGRVDLSKVTSVGEKWGEIDLEKLAALRPDLIVTTMWAPPDLWYILPEVAPKVEAIAPIVGINIAKQPITGPINRFADLAKALGADLNAPAVVADRKRFEQASADLKAAIAAKPGLKVLFGAGSLETFWVCLPGSYADLLYFQELGMDIVVPTAADAFVEALSWEQALKYPADLIVYDVRAHVTQPAELAAKIPTWSLHPAVKAGQVGRWHATASYSYKGFAGILEELTKTVQSAKADVVQ